MVTSDFDINNAWKKNIFCTMASKDRILLIKILMNYINFGNKWALKDFAIKSYKNKIHFHFTSQSFFITSNDNMLTKIFCKTYQFLQ